MKARENPYRSERILSVRYRFQNSSLWELLNRLEKYGYRGALVGPEGSGKTTLLEDLQPLFENRGRKVHWLRLTREYPYFSAEQKLMLQRDFNSEDMIFFDGAELLGRIRFQLLRWKLRHAGGLLITTHQPGYLPTLIRSKTSPELLREILDTLDPGNPPPDISGLFLRHRGNLREALREMYDHCMHLPENSAT